MTRLPSPSELLRQQKQEIAALTQRVKDLENRLNRISSGCPVALRLERDG